MNATIEIAEFRHGRIYIGDVMQGLAKIPANSVQCCVTSPPYWGLRDYGVEGQIGLEETPQQFVDSMVSVFAEVRRVLRPDGCCWVNLGDSYAGKGQAIRQPDEKRSSIVGYLDNQPNRSASTGLKPKDMAGIPWRVALALQESGWWLRQDIIWHKPSPMPSSVKDRCTTSHEYLFMLTKSPNYFYDYEAIAEPCSENTHSRGHGLNPKAKAGTRSSGTRQNESFSGAVNGMVSTRNARSVWERESFEIAEWLQAMRAAECDESLIQATLQQLYGESPDVWKIGHGGGYSGAHFATYPIELPTRCIKASVSEYGCCAECGTPWRRKLEKVRVATRPGNGSKVNSQHDASEVGNRDPERHVTETRTVGWEPGCTCDTRETAKSVVLDPFMGSGTTALAAMNLGCEFVGCELNPEYVDRHIRERLRQPTLI